MNDSLGSPEFGIQILNRLMRRRNVSLRFGEIVDYQFVTVHEIIPFTVNAYTHF
jgi:hypothetical protein